MFRVEEHEAALLVSLVKTRLSPTVNRRRLMGNAKSWAEFMTGRTSHLDKHKPIQFWKEFSESQPQVKLFMQ